MKADLLLLYSLLAIAALFAYVFVGGLVVRAANRLRIVRFDGCEYLAWPFILLAMIVGLTLRYALKASQWRPKRKSALPGARVVRK